jgi:hypothetical protein
MSVLQQHIAFFMQALLRYSQVVEIQRYARYL